MANNRIPKEIQDWEMKISQCLSARQPFEEQWYLNLAMYFGRQWALWDRSVVGNHRLLEPPQPKNRVRLTVNKIKPIIRREITKLTKEEPQFYIVPATTEPNDVMAARAGENLAEWSLVQGSYNSVRRSATFWASICGTGFMKTTSQGKNEPVLYEAPSPFHVLVPYLQEEELENQPYIVHQRGYSPEAVYDKYGIECKPDAVVNGATLEQRFLNAMGIRTTASSQNITMVKEIWIKPCKNYPEGGLLIMADKKILEAYEKFPVEASDDADEVPALPLIPKNWSQTEYPFDHKQFPFAKIHHIPTGRFYGDSVIVDLIPVQKEYNRTRSQMVEARNLTTKPQMAYIRGSIDPSKVTAQPGLMIGVQPGFEAPKYLPPPEISGFVIQDIDRQLQEFDDISNQFEVAKGRTPPGVEAASAIAYLQEENDDVLHATIASIEKATETIGKQTLQLIQQFWTDDHIEKVVSKNGAMESQVFKASNLKDNCDIRVESQSMAPRSRAAKQAFILDLIDKGIIQPQQGMRYLQMNETNRLYEEMQADERHAERENYRMARGEEVMPNAFDNVAVHLYKHELFMKSQEYELLDDATKAIFIAHHTLTKLQLQGQQMEAMGIPPEPQGEMTDNGPQE